MAETFQIVRALHILFAISWAGAAVYRSSVVNGAMRRDDGFTARFFANAMHGPFMAITSFGTVMLGGAVLGAADGAFGSDSLTTGQFIILYGGVTAATLAFLLSVAGHLPNDRRLLPLARRRIAGAAHDEAAYARLVKREHVMGHVSAALVTVAMVGMTSYRMFL